MSRLATLDPVPHSPRQRGRKPGAGPPLMDRSIEPTKALALAVLIRAIQDAHGVSQVAKYMHQGRAQVRYQRALERGAQRFIWCDNRALRFWCLVADVDPLVIIRAAKAPPADSLVGQQLEGLRYAAGTVAQAS